MMKKTISVLSIFITFVLIISFIPPVQASAKSIKLSETSLTIIPGYENVLTLDGAKAKKVKWTSSDKSIATVDKNGLVTAMSIGECTITAKYKKKKYTCKVIVPFMLTDNELSIDINDKRNLKSRFGYDSGVNIYYANIGKNYSIKYKVEDPSILSCEWDSEPYLFDSWYSRFLKINAKKNGSTKIIFTNTYNNEKIVCDVSVNYTKFNDNAVYLSASSSSISLSNTDPNKAIKISVNNDYYNILFDIEDSSIVTCEWGDWYDQGYSRDLYFYGLKDGTTTVTVYPAHSDYGHLSFDVKVSDIETINLDVDTFYNESLNTFIAKTSGTYNNSIVKVKFSDVEFDINNNYIEFYYKAELTEDTDLGHLVSKVNCYYSYSLYDDEGYVVKSGNFSLPEAYIGDKIKSSFKIYYPLDTTKKYELRIKADYIY